MTHNVAKQVKLHPQDIMLPQLQSKDTERAVDSKHTPNDFNEK